MSDLELDDKVGIAASIKALKQKFGATDDDFMELLGDSLYTAVMQNNYNFITVDDLMKIADYFGLVFVMHFQSLDVYESKGDEKEE